MVFSFARDLEARLLRESTKRRKLPDIKEH
jgi:hypothetical protein